MSTSAELSPSQLSNESTKHEHQSGSIFYTPSLPSSPDLLSADTASSASRGDFFSLKPVADTDDCLPSVQSPPLTIACPDALPLHSPSDDTGASFDAGLFESTRCFRTGLPPAASPTATLPTPPPERLHPLRLPSFVSLGIANPHPDAPVEMFDPVGLDPMDCSTRLTGHEEEPSVGGTVKDLSSFAPPPPEILTPPEEPVTFDWVSSHTLAKQPNTPVSGRKFSAEVTRATESELQDTLEAPASPRTTENQGTSSTSQLLRPSPAIDGLQSLANVVSSRLDISTFSSHEIRAMSHALPSPRIPGNAYPHIIERLRERLPSSPIRWLTLLHAVPGRYNVSDLPTSAPSTPGQPLGTAQDYFTTKVFPGMVQSVDYSAVDRVQPLQGRGAGNALAPPATINLCIVERFIPPPRATEFHNLFSVSKPSLLVDRMVELVPGNGQIVFIYPTIDGARDFRQHYLGPVLDPLMREQQVINSFTSGLMQSICSMEAETTMSSFENLKWKTRTLCEDMSSGSNSLVRQRLHGERGNFSLVYAESHHVELDRMAWSEWWTKQEKVRIREAVDRHFRDSQGRYSTASESITPSSIVHHILTQVAGEEHADGSRTAPRPYSSGRQPIDRRIEVAVFVLKREAVQ